MSQADGQERDAKERRQILSSTLTGRACAEKPPGTPRGKTRCLCLRKGDERRSVSWERGVKRERRIGREEKSCKEMTMTRKASHKGGGQKKGKPQRVVEEKIKPEDKYRERDRRCQRGAERAVNKRDERWVGEWKEIAETEKR